MISHNSNIASFFDAVLCLRIGKGCCCLVEVRRNSDPVSEAMLYKTRFGNVNLCWETLQMSARILL